MTRLSVPFRTTLAVLALLLGFAATDALAQRHRVVHRVPTERADLTGLVVDAATQAPLSEARITIGAKTAVTGEEGKFKFLNLEARSYTMTVTHWAHLSTTQSIELAAGDNSLTVPLTAKAIATFVAKNGTTYRVDPDSVEFGYFVAFVGWRAAAHLQLCPPAGGEPITILMSEVASVTFPGQRTESTDCCSLAPGTIASITPTEGEVVEGTIRSSCSSYEIFAIGRNRDTSVFEHIPVLDLERVEMP